MVIHRTTSFLVRNERAATLYEVNEMAPDYRGFRRVQTIVVVRDDDLAEYRTDLGPADEFTAPEFQIPAGFQHSVEELKDIALAQRYGDDYWQKRTEELSLESTLIPDYVDWTEERGRILNNTTKIGPGFTKQRNGYSRKGALEWSKQKR